MKQSIIAIEAPDFFTVLALRDGVVVIAAPNVECLRGKPEAEVVKHCRQHGWSATSLQPRPVDRKQLS